MAKAVGVAAEVMFSADLNKNGKLTMIEVCFLQSLCSILGLMSIYGNNH